MGKGTLVFQSYRTVDVAPWIEQCMETVRSWARAQGFSYRFLDDGFLSAAPGWFQAKCPSIYPVTDLCRLIWARQLLSEDWDRVVWIDADFLIFAPELFSVESERSEVFCHERVIRFSGNDFDFGNRINNSVSVYRPQSHFLHVYIEGCLRAARSTRELGDLALGTEPLTRIHRVFPFDLLENVGCFTPPVHTAINQGQTDFLRLQRMIFARPLAAANMVRSLTEASRSDANCTEAVERLLRSAGGVVNAV